MSMVCVKPRLLPLVNSWMSYALQTGWLCQTPSNSSPLFPLCFCESWLFCESFFHEGKHRREPRGAVLWAYESLCTLLLWVESTHTPLTVCPWGNALTDPQTWRYACYFSSECNAYSLPKTPMKWPSGLDPLFLFSMSFIARSFHHFFLLFCSYVLSFLSCPFSFVHSLFLFHLCFCPFCLCSSASSFIPSLCFSRPPASWSRGNTRRLRSCTRRSWRGPTRRSLDPWMVRCSLDLLIWVCWGLSRERIDISCHFKKRENGKKRGHYDLVVA